MLITNSNFFFEGGVQAGALAMNDVFWDVLLCDLVEMYQYFGETAVLVFILEDSFILRNVKKESYLQE